MIHLSLMYSILGRHQDALVMDEKALELLRRVLPEYHASIGAPRLAGDQ
jgi:hypothetical protein